METTRVKGRDIAQSSAIALLCSSELPERAVNKGLCAVRVAAHLPQGDL